MAERYRKIDPRFWTDERVILLAAEEKLVALYCFTGQANRIGLYCFSPGRAAEETALTPQTFAKGFGKVRETLHLGWDTTTHVLHLPTWWRYNRPENPNVMRAVLTDLHDLPRTSLGADYLAAGRRSLSGACLGVFARCVAHWLNGGRIERQRPSSAVVAAVRERDGDHCRHCGASVSWLDHRGNRGGTVDHLDPLGPATTENLVVSCRSCNSRKGLALSHISETVRENIGTVLDGSENVAKEQEQEQEQEARARTGAGEVGASPRA